VRLAMAQAREMSSELWLFGLKKTKYKMKKKKKWFMELQYIEE
jgi:hypothetical protein